MEMSDFRRIQCLSICLLVVLQLVLVVVQSEMVDIYNAPTLSNSDSVQFFYLEAPFPYNAPQSVVDAAGSNFDRFGVSHAGLGIWDTTTDVKFTIEFVANDYVGALLPQLNPDGSITWNNQGSIVITNPLIESNWLNSRLLTTTSGNAWTQIINYLQSVPDKFTIYQPVTGIYLNASLFNTSSVYSTDDINDVGKVVLPGMDSFTFVDELVTQLGSYGSDLGAFLQIYATSFDYIAGDSKEPVAVSLTVPGNNAEVYRWFSDLEVCYKNIFQMTGQVTNGAAYFLNGVQLCYHEYAYVYKSPSEVYNLSLGNVSDGAFVTPMLDQYIYDLPPDDVGSKEQLEVIDYIVIAIAFCACCYGVYFFFNKFFGKKQRRRVSFESERIAARTVENITDGLEDDEQEHRAYFHGKGHSGRMSATWSKAFPTGRLSYANPLRTNSSTQYTATKGTGLATAETTNDEN